MPTSRRQGERFGEHEADQEDDRVGAKGGAERIKRPLSESNEAADDERGCNHHEQTPEGEALGAVQDQERAEQGERQQCGCGDPPANGSELQCRNGERSEGGRIHHVAPAHGD